MRKTVNGRGTPYNEFHTEDGDPIVEKTSRVSGIINFRYGNSVNNQREREQGPDHEPFEPEPRRWGVRMDDAPLVRHTPKHSDRERFYLEVKVEQALETFYVDTQRSQEIQGERLDSLRDFMYNNSQSSGRQNVETPVILRDIRLDRIREIRVGGEIYHVV